MRVNPLGYDVYQICQINGVSGLNQGYATAFVVCYNPQMPVFSAFLKVKDHCVKPQGVINLLSQHFKAIMRRRIGVFDTIKNPNMPQIILINHDVMPL
jgi:hypothetical protein